MKGSLLVKTAASRTLQLVAGSITPREIKKAREYPTAKAFAVSVQL